jgi:hypothetical protein
MKQLIKYSLLTSAWIVAVLYLSRTATEQANLWLVIVAALLVSIPALLAVLYTDTIALIHRATKFRTEGRLKQFTTSRVLSTVFWTLWAIIFGFGTVFWLGSASHLEIGSLFLTVVVLYLLNSTIKSITDRELKAYYTNASAIRWSRIFSAMVVTALFLLLSHQAGSGQEIEPLGPRYIRVADTSFEMQKSYLVQLATKAFSYLQETRAYLISLAETISPLYLLAVWAGTFALFYNLTFLLSGFLIPSSEYRRVFSPIDTCDEPASVAVSNTIFTSTIVTLFFFLLIPTTANLEQIARAKMASVAEFKAAESKLVTYAEMIDETLYSAGTIRQLNEVKFDVFREHTASINAIDKQSSLAFDGMRGNVDVYLDKYYSLAGEYFRVLGALTGTIERLITEDLTSTLMSGGVMTGLDSAIKTELSRQPEVQSYYKSKVSAILEENRLIKPKGEIHIVGSASTDVFASPPESAVLISLNQRMGAAGVGAIGGFIAAKVVSKVVAKGAIKLAAKAVAKVATIKLGGGAFGAAVGAAIGSVVPVAGTITGTVIGFVAGVALGVSIDALLLTLEESYAREDFKAQIINAIDEQEREFKAMMSI